MSSARILKAKRDSRCAHIADDRHDLVRLHPRRKLRRALGRRAPAAAVPEAPQDGTRSKLKRQAQLEHGRILHASFDELPSDVHLEVLAIAPVVRAPLDSSMSLSPAPTGQRAMRVSS